MKHYKITADLIPHSEFHTGIWLLSIKRPEWYYFLKKENHNSIKQKGFLKSVDRPLRALVKFLHNRGIKTTPSCSGHHFRERNLEQIYEVLEKDREEIRTSGLSFQDVETGKVYFFNDKNYNLPWTKEQFIERVIVYQQKGVIGLRLGNRKMLKEKIVNLKLENAKVEERDSIVFVFTDGENKGDNKQTWKKITRRIKDVFKTEMRSSFYKRKQLLKESNAVAV